MAENKFAGNIDLSALSRKRFTIDGDENRVLELDLSDLSIINRLEESYPKLEELSTKMSSLGDENTDISASITEVDTKMRELLDFIFNSNVCEICAPYGSMMDPVGGQLRYEHIINALVPLFEKGIGAELKKVQNRMRAHTKKYTEK